jgi:hypothetical protein
MDYTTAKAHLAAAVAADPFAMEAFRKFGFWAQVTITAAENGKRDIAVNAYNKLLVLEETAKLDIFADVTGVTPTIFKAARAAFSKVINAAA